jgi:hypothetical protein
MKYKRTRSSGGTKTYSNSAQKKLGRTQPKKETPWAALPKKASTNDQKK